MALSRSCEDLAQNVDDPAIGPAANPKFAVGEYAVALGSANDNLDATRSCQQNQRERLAKGK